jgi:ligand-binding sensor domain-containing protein
MEKHYLRTQIYLFLLLFVWITSCNGQNKTEKQVETNLIELPKILKSQGIYKDAAIGCGVQDKAGNLWFGSNGEGVYRYNPSASLRAGGKPFTHFTVKDGLDNDIVYSILEDKAGNIWVGTKTGLNRYTPSASAGEIAFTKMPIIVTRGNNTSFLNGVWSMMQDKKGTIWLGTDEGVYCYNGIYFTRFLDNTNVFNKDTLQLKAIFSILEDKTGKIWFGACINDGISRFDGKTLINIVPHKDVRRVNNIIEDKLGNILFATSFNGICRYEPSTLLKVGGKAFTKNIFMRKQGYQGNVLKDKAGNIWFDEYEGLGYYDSSASLGASEKTFKTLTEKDGLPNNNIYPIFEDKSGNLWFSTVGMGLYRYDASEKIFVNFSE